MGYTPIKGYENYYVIGEDGEIVSLRFYIPLKHSLSSGYPVVHLYKNKRAKTHTVHRLLAEHFIDNPDNLPLVNHKNGNTLDFSLDNLEWVTASYNVKDGFNRGRIHPQLGKRYVDRTKNCELCKQVFQYVKPRQRFCSKQCSGINNLQLAGVTIALAEAGELQ